MLNEKAIRVLQNLQECLRSYHSSACVHNCGICDYMWTPQGVSAAIDTAVSALGPMWINVKDRLPETDRPVLACYRSGWVWIDVCTKSGTWLHGDFPGYDDEGEDSADEFMRHVEYWMPLPEAPIKEEN